MQPLVKTTRLEGHARLRADRARAGAEGGLDVRQGARAWSWRTRQPALMTSEYRVAKRPQGRVLVDYNQNAWGRTLASIYSVRPQPLATVSTPVTWEEVEQRRRDRGLPPRQRARADCEASAICGSRCSQTRGRTNSRRL